MPSANWYTDPLDASRGRYWDGNRWSDETTPIPPGQSLPTFVAEGASSPAPPPPAWGAPAPQWGGQGSTLPPAPPSLPPGAHGPNGSNGSAHYTAYGAFGNRRQRNGSMLVVSGALSLTIGILLTAFDVSHHSDPILVIVGVLIAARGAFWIVRGLR